MRLPRSGAHRGAKAASLPWEDEKYAYAALTRLPHVAATRIVGRPRYRSRLVELPLCTPEGLEDRIVTPRAGAPAYRNARNVYWGDDWPV